MWHKQKHPDLRLWHLMHHPNHWHVPPKPCTCVFSNPTWVYWPRLCQGGRSSGTPSPFGCCRNSAWSSACAPACCQQPPPPAASPLEEPNLVGDAEALSNWNQNISSTESREGNPAVSHCCLFPLTAFRITKHRVLLHNCLPWRGLALVNTAWSEAQTNPLQGRHKN